MSHPALAVPALTWQVPVGHSLQVCRPGRQVPVLPSAPSTLPRRTTRRCRRSDSDSVVLLWPVVVLLPVPMVLVPLLVRRCRLCPQITLRLYRSPRSLRLKSEVRLG